MRSFASDREKHKYYNSLTAEQKYEAFCDILFESESTVFLGGAGVSTESGIPDFRSRNGLYRKRPKGFLRYKPEYLLIKRGFDIVASLCAIVLLSPVMTLSLLCPYFNVNSIFLPSTL